MIGRQRAQVAAGPTTDRKGQLSVDVTPGASRLTPRTRSQRPRGADTVAIEADLADPEAPARVFDQAQSRLGHITALMMCHCDSVDSGLLDTTLGALDRIALAAAHELAHLGITDQPGLLTLDQDAVLEPGAGPDQGDEVGSGDRPPAVLGGLDGVGGPQVDPP